jgi:hypothetical protein
MALDVTLITVVLTSPERLQLFSFGAAKGFPCDDPVDGLEINVD